ncbi:DinB family protein [Kribbella endophytica]
MVRLPRDFVRGTVLAVTTDTSSQFRADPPSTGDERAMLQGFLDFHRGTLLWKVSELSGEDLVRPTVDPSGMTLLGLVRHLTEVERYWFHLSLDGRMDSLKLWTDEHPDGDFDLVSAAEAEADLATFRQVVAESDAIARGYELDHVFTRPRGGPDLSVRWLYIHMVEEYSRHNGHADLLRERIDGLVGE